jgi:hypothetical protein
VIIIVFFKIIGKIENGDCVAKTVKPKPDLLG